MAEINTRKRRRRVVSSEKTSEANQDRTTIARANKCNASVEEELFDFVHKQSLESLAEEDVVRKVQSELLEDCTKERDEDVYGRLQAKNAGSKSWKLVEKPGEKREKNKHRSSQKCSSTDPPNVVSSDDSDNEDINGYLYAPPSYIPPSVASQTLHNNVARTLHNLKAHNATPTTNDIIDCTTPSPAHYNITLRIRCRGRIHRYSTLTVKPFSDVVSHLAEDLGVVKERILLSFKSESVALNATPENLGLTTVDFVDALVLDKAITLDDSTSEIRSDQVTVRVQSVARTVSYRLSKGDPLDKVLAAFTAVLEVPRECIKFEFDGDPVLPSNTAEELGLENEDVIDARVVKC